VIQVIKTTTNPFTEVVINKMTVEPNRLRGTNQIKLLKIRPSVDPNHMECQLQTVSLDTPPRFEALSYVWGSRHTTTNILLEGVPVAVTQNLAAALHRLRNPRRQRVIWVDCLCIDQKNTDELSYQVSLIGAIFKKAERVVCMLGEPSPELYRIITWTDRYVSKKVTRRTLYWWKMDLKAWFSPDTKREREIAILDAFHGYEALLRLPYWTRMWTYQEYHLPKREPICMCGDMEFKSSRRIGGVSSINKLWKVCTAIATRNTPAANQDDKERAHCMQVQERSELLSDDYQIEHLSDHFTLEDSVRDGPDILRAKLGGLLALTCHRLCTDPRDKVYALYALVPEAQAVYPPDYNKPIQQVLVETTGISSNTSHKLAFSAYFPSVTTILGAAPCHRGYQISIEHRPGWGNDLNKSMSWLTTLSGSPN
jgi:hypothetical protein